MKGITKILLPLTAVIIVIFLSGCSASGFNVDNFMRPPAATGYSAEIQSLLNESLGSEFTLRYPRSGEYRSAVVLADIDTDEAQEAVVFYRLSTESSGSHMIVLDCSENGKWSTAGISEGGAEIDRVMLGDVNGDGVDEVITGWNDPSIGSVINVHSLSGGVLHRISIVTGEQDSYPANVYSEMAVGDYDGDMRDEIMTVYRSAAEGVAVARILRLGYGVDGSAQMRTADSINTDGSVYRYINAQAGYMGIGCFGMVLDGCRAANQYVTEIIYWDKESGRLVAPLNNSDSLTAVFVRTQASVSKDVNGDGMIEIPSDRILAGYSPRSVNPMYLTSWYNYSGNEPQLALQAVMRQDHGYYFRFLSGWSGKITVQPDVNENIMYCYLIGDDNPFETELFRIKIFTLDSWDDRSESLADTLLQLGEDAPDYQMLATTEYYVYAVLLSPQAQEMGITFDTVKECFRLTA